MPGVSTTAQAAGSQLIRLINETIIENAGWISFERFMQLALYAPGCGYYNAGAQKFGASGDFITAPMLGDHFARCLVRQCVEIFSHSALVDKKNIIEFGAGDGRLAADMLRCFHASDVSLPRYYIVEPSAPLREIQKTRLQKTLGAQAAKQVIWLNEFPRQGFGGIVIANEVLDAMPVMRFRVQQNGVQELGVALDENDSGWIMSCRDTREVRRAYEDLACFGLPAGYESEIARQAAAWIRTLAEYIEVGAVLLIDYGFPAREYYHPDRTEGTLMCHYRHRAHDNPLINPGLQDITAHVDFSAIARTARESGFNIAGYCHQAAFLLSLGIGEALSALADEVSADALAAAQDIKKLTLPHEMGELFKVLVLTRNLPIPLTGFSLINHKERL